MTHKWKVVQTDDSGTKIELGCVRAMTRKGACYEAFQAFRIGHNKRHTIMVERIADVEHMIIGIDPAKAGENRTVEHRQLVTGEGERRG